MCYTSTPSPTHTVLCPLTYNARSHLMPCAYGARSVTPHYGAQCSCIGRSAH